MAAPTIKLNSGYLMPVLGLGTFQSRAGEVENAVREAIDVGYRHIDTAIVYGNEKEIGAAVKSKIAEGIVRREELFIVTKLWISYLEKNTAIEMCKKSLENLGLDYIDLYLIHAPFGIKDPGATFEPDFLSAWEGLEECVKLAYTRSIGVSNFNSEQIDRLLAAAKIKPVCNQVECNTNLNQLKLIDFCKQRDIVITAHSPLGRPGQTGPDVPKSHINDDRVLEIGRKYGKTGAQVILRFLIQINAYPLPKSVTKERIKQNIEIFDFELNDEEMEFMKSLNTNQRFWKFGQYVNNKEYPFHIEF